MMVKVGGWCVRVGIPIKGVSKCCIQGDIVALLGRCYATPCLVHQTASLLSRRSVVWLFVLAQVHYTMVFGFGNPTTMVFIHMKEVMQLWASSLIGFDSQPVPFGHLAPFSWYTLVVSP
ncbi:predicted protein [Lichtheimia corymbifera JMRC:FSU:9682]|uniref:Uncharacterized protein n=1 Tax=Lichtheimia corymbifera JMRC:FSU:9682 TaxID=1263082 RepID=A0A068RY08_9FUNG|nr:predicted protein [Lichtheimia corymbifera JMRC:FSU:9682]